MKKNNQYFETVHTKRYKVVLLKVSSLIAESFCKGYIVESDGKKKRQPVFDGYYFDSELIEYSPS